MSFKYTEYYEDEPGKDQMNDPTNENPKDPVEIVIKVTMDRKRYEARKNKYKEELWTKAYKIFFN